LVTSRFFGYSGSYQSADTLKPGLGYWVKVGQAGTLLLSQVAGANGKIRIVENGELPPPPPGDEIKSVSNGPKAFALTPAYPNPFNPTTHFTADVPKESEVRVAVYDLLGQKISTLMAGRTAAGSYQLTWNGQNDNGQVTPSGIYFVRMVSGDFTAVQKLMLMK
jgi:hypothetical protein